MTLENALGVTALRLFAGVMVSSLRNERERVEQASPNHGSRIVSWFGDGATLRCRCGFCLLTMTLENALGVTALRLFAGVMVSSLRNERERV